ncbi:MAG: MFS transporter [Chitinophagaceae bacterium]|nr:MFS transporter [Chitinophagaceae bacterium]
MLNKNPHYVVAVALLLITLSVNISMPLFRVYGAEAGMNNTQISLVLATYIMGMLPCYVLLGGLSDKTGRKPIMILSVICALASTTIITLFPDMYALIISRVLQGVALGLSMGCGTAYMSELLKPDHLAATKAANMASLFTSFGFGGGALATTVVLLIHFSVVPVTYYILLAITFIGLLFVLFLPAIPPIGGSLLRLPYFPKGSFPVNLAIAICWAANGVVVAIIPGQLAKYGLTIYGGFCLVLINWSGALLQPFIRHVNPVFAVRTGFLLIPAGFGLVVLGCYINELLVILAGTCIMGVAAYGYSFMGGLNIISNLGGVQKARAVSGYMFYGYIGFGIPAIFLGYLADRFSIINSLLFFEGVIILLSVYLFSTFKRNASSVS